MLGLRTPLGAVRSSLWITGWVMAGIVAPGAIAALLPGQLPPQAPRSVATVPVRPTFTTIPSLSGFSGDGRHYLQVESSRDTGAGIPKAWLQVVDLATNGCVAEGCLETHYGEGTAGRSLAQAELELLRRIWPLRQALGLATPQPGQSLPILSRSRDETGTEILTFRLPGQARPTELRLWQPGATGAPPGSDTPNMPPGGLELRHQGQRQRGPVAARFQETGQDYSIREVKLSPGGDRLAILLTATQPTFEGTLAITLVQGFALESAPSPTIP